MIQPLVVGNWKMNKTIGEAILFAGQLKERLKGRKYYKPTERGYEKDITERLKKKNE